MTALATTALHKAFGPVVAVEDVTLAVSAGEIYGLLGPNGAGKTTLIRCLLGYLRPTAGCSQVLDGDPREPRRRARIGYLPGDLRLEPKLTGRQIQNFHARLLAQAGHPVSARALEEMATGLDLALDRRFGTLSKGNRQKVGIALALMGEREVLILDEPTSGLDPIVQDYVASLLRQRRDQGTAILLSTHILSEAESIADRVGVLSHGRLVVEDTMSALLARARQRLTFSLARPAAEDLLVGVPGVEWASPGGREVALVVRGSLEPVIARLAPLGIERIRSDAGELDEVFHASTDEPAQAHEPPQAGES